MAYEKYKLKSETPQRSGRPSGAPQRSGRTSGTQQRSTRPSGTPQRSGNAPSQRRTGTGQSTGTIRNNMDRYQTDRVSQAKGRPMSPATKAALDREIAAQQALKHEKRKKLIIRLSILLIVIIICGLCFLFAFKVFYDTPVNEEDTKQVEITIASDEVTDDEVGKMLYDAGCIDDIRLYKIRTKVYEADYVPGTYKVSPSYSTEKIINILSGYDYSTEGVMDENQASKNDNQETKADTQETKAENQETKDANQETETE